MGRSARLVDIRRPGFKPVQRGARVCRNGPKRLIDFVCDRGRKLSRPRDAVHLRQLGHRSTRCELSAIAAPVLIDEPGYQSGLKQDRGDDRRGTLEVQADVLEKIVRAVA